MEYCKTAKMPADPSIQLTKDMAPKSDWEKDFMPKISYQSTVCFLLWLATSTHPDIAPAIHTICHFSSNPGKQHWIAVK